MSDQPTEIVIEMKDVAVGTMRDQEELVLENVDWTVARDECWIVAGQQHSGKSDFLMMTAGLMPPAHGTYKFFGSETRIFDESRIADRLRMGFIFENAQLFPELSMAENVALPLQYHRNLPLAEAVKAVTALLEAMELKPIADVTPANLPRSWHRRAGLARALTLQPEILLLDNPLGGLDARHAQWWVRFLDALWRGHVLLGGRPMTLIATTDDLRPWRNDARRFALLKDGDFVPLGSWKQVASLDEPMVKELLSAPIGLA